MRTTAPCVTWTWAHGPRAAPAGQVVRCIGQFISIHGTWSPYCPFSSFRCFSSQMRESAASPAPLWRMKPHNATVVYAPCSGATHQILLRSNSSDLARRVLGKSALPVNVLETRMTFEKEDRGKHQMWDANDSQMWDASDSQYKFRWHRRARC